MIEALQQGKINIPLFCELATHKDFPKLLVDIEIYVNCFASKMIGFLNSFVDAGREQILAKAKPLQPDNILNLLSNISIDEGNYFDRRLHDDMDAIIKDMRETYKDRIESTSYDLTYEPISFMSETLDELAQFKGSQLEKAVMIFCKSNGIIYSKLTDEERIWLTKIIKKSKTAKGPRSQRGRK